MHNSERRVRLKTGEARGLVTSQAGTLGTSARVARRHASWVHSPEHVVPDLEEEARVVRHVAHTEGVVDAVLERCVENWVVGVWILEFVSTVEIHPVHVEDDRICREQLRVCVCACACVCGALVMCVVRCVMCVIHTYTHTHMRTMSMLVGISSGMTSSGRARTNWSGGSSAITAKGDGLWNLWWCLWIAHPSADVWPRRWYAHS